MDRPVVILVLFAGLASATLPRSIYDGCGSSYGCFGTRDRETEGECLQDQSCTIVVTYRGTSEDQFGFELYGDFSALQMSAYDGYVAFGLNKEYAGMDPASVVVCQAHSDISHVGYADMYYTPSGQGRVAVPLEDTTLGIFAPIVSVQDDVIACSLYRDTVVDLGLFDDDSKKFDTKRENQ